MNVTTIYLKEKGFDSCVEICASIRKTNSGRSIVMVEDSRRISSRTFYRTPADRRFTVSAFNRFLEKGEIHEIGNKEIVARVRELVEG